MDCGSGMVTIDEVREVCEARVRLCAFRPFLRHRPSATRFPMLYVACPLRGLKVVNVESVNRLQR